MEEIASRLAEIPGVVAVTLGGSRAQGTELPGSDWDFGLYYRGTIDPADVEALGWPGRVTGPRGWGPVVNGGAWLTIEGARVDLCYRDLDEVLEEAESARAGNFRVWHLPNYVAGIPSYVMVGELAVGRVLVGSLPRPSYPAALAEKAPPWWRGQRDFVLMSAGSHAVRGDRLATLGNMARVALCEAQARLAERELWALNEKGLLERAGIDTANLLAGSTRTPSELSASVEALRTLLSQGGDK